MTTPSSSPAPARSSSSAAVPPASGFSRLWRWLLPIGLGVIAAAYAVGVFDTSARPAWMFVVGLVIALAGAASLSVRLVERGRARFVEIEETIEAKFEEVRKS
ncbi:MAG: hypothetical protein ABTQ29_09785 [Siculibacillus sp.]